MENSTNDQPSLKANGKSEKTVSENNTPKKKSKLPWIFSLLILLSIIIVIVISSSKKSESPIVNNKKIINVEINEKLRLIHRWKKRGVLFNVLQLNIVEEDLNLL